MDDRDLEARLRTHLHRRFDAAQPSPELVSSVRQAVSTPPRRVGLADLRVRDPRLGWSVVVAAALVAVVAIAQLQFGVFTGIGGPRPTATPAATDLVPLDRRFIVLPPTSELPTKAESSLAARVLTDRLATFGFQSITSATGYGIQIILPLDGPDDDRIRDVLGATGDVEFVPLPAETYGDSDGPKLQPQVGEELPTDEPALFGWDGVASIAIGEETQSRVLTITLKPAAAQAFGDYTTEHVGEFFAIVVDGRVATVPTINEPILDGQLQVSGNGDPSDGSQEAMAILVGGLLPQAWRDPVVPELLSAEEAIAAARDAVEGGADATVVAADLDVTPMDGGWQVGWVVELHTATGVMQVVMDAERGS